MKDFTIIGSLFLKKTQAAVRRWQTAAVLWTAKKRPV